MFITHWKPGADFIHLLFDADQASGDAASGGGLSDEALKAFNKRLEKLDGNASAMAMMLFGENFQMREKLRSLEGRVSPDGATILTGDDAKAWDVYKALGKPETVKQGLDERSQFQGELESLRREAILRRVAEVAGFKYNILADREKAARADNKPLAFEVREVEVDGVKRATAFIKEGSTEKTADDYAREQWSDYLSVLQVTQGGDGQQSTSTTAGNGTRFIGQTAATGGNRSQPDLVGKYLQEQAEAAKAISNPFIPKDK
jgi:hypothetical protein